MLGCSNTRAKLKVPNTWLVLRQQLANKLNWQVSAETRITCRQSQIPQHKPWKRDPESGASIVKSTQHIVLTNVTDYYNCNNYYCRYYYYYIGILVLQYMSPERISLGCHKLQCTLKFVFFLN